MPQYPIGSTKIYRPTPLYAERIRRLVGDHLRSAFPPGRYTDPVTINAILQHQFRFLENHLDTTLPRIASLDLLQFVLFQYDQSGVMERHRKNGALDQEERESWEGLAPRFRRAAKFLAERLCQMRVGEHDPLLTTTRRIRLLDESWTAAEQMVELYTLSDHTYRLFPEDTALEIVTDDQPGLLKMYTRFPVAAFDVDADRERRQRILPNGNPFLETIARQETILDPAIKADIGASYRELLSVLALTVDRSVPNDPYRVPVVDMDNLCTQLSSVIEIGPAVVRRAVDGFLITPTKMDQENRCLWKPKQKYRAYRRGFFEVAVAGRPHVVFSKEMATEALCELRHDVPFHYFPEEWRTPRATAALSKLSQLAGAWFEDFVAEALRSRGAFIWSRVKAIGRGESRICVPAAVGEIDVMAAYPHRDVLVVVECKLVRASTEPSLFYDDLMEMKAFAERTIKKREWAANNVAAIATAMRSTSVKATEIKFTTVQGIIVTYYPSIGAQLPNVRCVALTSLLADIDAVNGEWPYCQETGSVGSAGAG